MGAISTRALGAAAWLGAWILALLRPPFGTALGIYTIGCCCRKQSAQEYDQLSSAPYKLDSSTAGKRDNTIDQAKLSVGETISSFQNESAFSVACSVRLVSKAVVVSLASCEIPELEWHPYSPRWFLAGTLSGGAKSDIPAHGKAVALFDGTTWQTSIFS